MAKPVNVNVAAVQHSVAGGPDVKESRHPLIGSVKDFTQAAGAKVTGVMRDVALSIARKIDGIWDRISPSHGGSAVRGVNSVFKDPTISIPQLNERMAPPVPTRKNVQALFELRSEIFQLGREHGKHAEIQSKIDEYKALLDSMGGSDGDFYKWVDELGASAMDRCREEQLRIADAEEVVVEGQNVGYASEHSMDFELEGLKAMLEGPYADVGKVHVGADKPREDDGLSIDDDFCNWRDPSQSSTKERTLVSGFQFLRENIKEEGAWRLSGSASSKKQKLEKIDKGIAPAFTDVKEATDVLKVLIGATSYDSITPYLNHSLSLEQFKELSEKAEKGELTLDIINEALKAAFGGDCKKLAMFKQLLVLLKETSKHAEDNKMTVENLVICPLNGLLQRYFRAEAGEAAKNCHLGAFMINNADAILADI
ncbi:MAG: RhoGAP domain-containing protein [Parachlamydiales bacterium]